MFVVGLDIGYSNVKVAYGEKKNGRNNSSAITTKVMPVGAAPVEQMPRPVVANNSVGVKDFFEVVIAGEKWVAGVEPDRLQNWSRELHDHYPKTKAYQALFYAALLITGKKEIDVLVTGLPVNQFMDNRIKEDLVSRLEGVHEINNFQSVKVKRVVVIPQPAGAYLDVVNSTDDSSILEAITEGKAAVIDPGFFSVDWVALNYGEVRYQSCGTSLNAMSVIVEETARIIKRRFECDTKSSLVEKIIRNGDREIMIFGEKREIKPFLDMAVEKISREGLTPMKESMRKESMSYDIVLVAGGGAESYKKEVSAMFPKSRIVVPINPVISNCRGFWYCA